MILSFSDPSFMDKIQRGEKIHTIRVDQHKRWKPGMSIQFWNGSPRSKRYGAHPFHVDRFGHPDDVKCTSVQEILIKNLPPCDADIFGWSKYLYVEMGLVRLSNNQVHALAKNDGLSIDEFIDWFVPNPGDVFTGSIIHWSGKSYPQLFEKS